MLSLDDIADARRLVVMDAEATGKPIPTREQVERMPRGMRLPGVVIQLGCVELLRDGATWVKGATWESLVNPEGPMSTESRKIHGIHPNALAKAPRFAAVWPDLRAFLQDSRIVAHSADSEIAYLNHECRRCGVSDWDNDAFRQDRFLDTQVLARAMMPECGRSLDAVCDRLWVDRSDRFTFHGALLDSDLTADVFCKLAGGFVRDELRVASFA